MLTTLLLSGFAILALALSTWDAYIATKSRGKRRRAIIVGVLGGFVILLQCMQTLKSSQESRQRNVEALAAELIANHSRIEGLSHPEEQDALNLALPELQSAVLKGVLASGTFAGEKDNKMLDLLTLLNEQVEDFNGRMKKTRENMWSANAEERLMWRRKVKDSPARRGITDTMIRLSKLLVTDYGLNSERSFFETLESPRPATSTRP